MKTYSTFTVTYPGQPYDEAGWADDVVKQTGAQPIFVDVLANTDIDADLRAVIAACDEPVHSPSVFNLLTLMRAVRAAGVTVMLGGQGADEMFWGYPWTYAYSLAHWLRRGPRARVLKELAAVLSRGNSAPKYVAAYLAYQSLFTLRYHRGAARAKPFLAPASAAAGDREYIRSRTALLPYRALHRRDVLSTNLQPLLRYEDRISMRFGIEARLPFCDYRMAELAHRCRPEDLLHDGWSKYIFRTAMAGVVPDPVLWRREKRGFAAPVEDLLARAHGLRDEAADEMPRLAEVVDVPRARAAVGDPRVPWQIRWRLVNLAVGLACLRSGIHAQ